MTTLSDLRERLEGASGPSRELDARLWAALYPNQPVMLFGGDVRNGDAPIWGVLANFPPDGWTDYETIANSFSAPDLTASIDAALALVSQKLPDAHMSLHDVGGAYWLGEIADRPAWSAKAPTAPLAILCVMAKFLATLDEQG